MEKERKEAQATAENHRQRQQAEDEACTERRQEIANIAIGIVVFLAFLVGAQTSPVVGVALCVFVFFVFER